MLGARRAGSCFAAASLLAAMSCERIPHGADEAPDGAGAELVGGELDPVSSGVVALVVRAGAGYAAFCSGTLIAPNLVLTARHCLSVIQDSEDGGVVCGVTLFGDDYDPSALRVAVDADTTDGTPAANVFAFADVAHFPSDGDPCNNDVSLVLLARNVPASVAQPIAPRVDSSPPLDARFSAVGYGLTSPDDAAGSSSGQRLRVDDNTVFCVGSGCFADVGADILGNREWIGDSPACPGDSGGPALDASGRVMGVASRGDDRCSVAIYADVSRFASFIVPAAQQAAAVGGFPVPVWAGGSGAPADAGAPDASGPGADASAPDPGSDPFEPDAAAEPPSDAAPPPVRGGEAGSGSSETPMVDIIGQRCTTDCPGVYSCYLEDDEPPGICVPPCADEAPRCPEDYVCSRSLDVCVPERVHQVSASCAFSPANAGGPLPPLALFAALALQRFWVRRSTRRR